MPVSNVPKNVTFGKKILFIPSLKEMGIPKFIGGLGSLKLAKELQKYRYFGKWVKRGDKLLKYRFKAFSKDKLKIFEELMRNDPEIYETWNITSPTDGLIVFLRHEHISSVNPSTRITYNGCNQSILPIILIPNDEPLPATNNFNQYDNMNNWLESNFNRLLIKNDSTDGFKRLKEHTLTKKYRSVNYKKYYDQLEKRNSKYFNQYLIREIETDDDQIINNIQSIRTKYSDLRSKLVHISREFGETI